MPTLHSLFQSIVVETPSHLESSLVLSLRLERARLYRRKLALIQSGVIGAGILLLLTLFWTIPLLIQSDFWSLSSLAFTDLGILSAFFGDFLYSLLETLPIVPLALNLFTLLFLSFLMSQWLAVRSSSPVLTQVQQG